MRQRGLSGIMEALIDGLQSPGVRPGKRRVRMRMVTRSDRGHVERGDSPTSVGDESGGERKSETTPSETYLRIDEVAKRTGLTKRTLRYYEELGLLDPAQRSEGNYRLFRAEDLDTLRRIKEMRDLLGLGLSEIREIVRHELERKEARARFYHPDAPPAARLGALADAERVTREQLHMIDTRIEALDKMGQSLRERLAIYERRRAEIAAEVKRLQESVE
jgi:MerR family transcriptional regulator, repressor of the yfmOP operon